MSFECYVARFVCECVSVQCVICKKQEKQTCRQALLFYFAKVFFFLKKKKPHDKRAKFVANRDRTERIRELTLQFKNTFSFKFNNLLISAMKYNYLHY